MGGATTNTIKITTKTLISIHAPRGGSDEFPYKNWGRMSISIHAPRGGSDLKFRDIITTPNISIHAPRGGSDWWVGLWRIFSHISIHAPRGGSDIPPRAEAFFFVISIHAPRGGSDSLLGFAIGDAMDFNPRSPWGERPIITTRNLRFLTFQSTLPVGGATKCLGCQIDYSRISIHAPRGGSDGH